MPLPLTYVDNANRANTAAGAGFGTADGLTWEHLSGQGNINNNLFNFSTAAGANPIAVVQFGSPNVDVKVDVAAAGGGDSIYFRVVDANNWWRVRYRHYQVSQAYYSTQYEYLCHYATYSKPTMNYNGTHSTYEWGGCFGAYEDQYNSVQLAASSATGNSQQVYAGTSTADFYHVFLEKCVGGVVTVVHDQTLNAQSVTSITAVAEGNFVRCGWKIGANWAYSSSYTDATHNTATKHGIGRGTSEITTSALDNFSIQNLNPATPTAVTPASGATVTTDLPSLGLTLSASTLTVKGVWQLARNAAFTQNLTEIEEPDGDFKVSGTATEVVPEAQQLFSGVWYIRGAVETQNGQRSAWTAHHTFTVTHLPAAASMLPTGGTLVAFGGGDIDFDWVFTDPSPVDVQTAFQIIVERASDGLVVLDTGKVLSPISAHTAAINPIYEEVPLRWKIRLWDSDDAVGNYSSYQLFTPASMPTVSISAPTEGSTVTSPAPSVAWAFGAAGGRPQHSYRIWFEDLLGVTIPGSDTGWTVSTDTAYDYGLAFLENEEDYVVHVAVRDTAALEAEDTNSFTAQWIPPVAPLPVTVNSAGYETSGYVSITWDNSDKDPAWFAWRVYRRYGVGDPWGLLEQIVEDTNFYEYRDYLTPANVTVQYAVVQVVVRFGTEVESAYTPYGTTPKSGDYWLISEDGDPNKNVRLYMVINESFSDDWEEGELLLIGKGRHTDTGEHWGYSGQLTIQLRDNGAVTARQQRLQLERIKAERVPYFLRNPFGDILLVDTAGIQMSRMPGVGVNEYGDVTLAYKQFGS